MRRHCLLPSRATPLLSHPSQRILRSCGHSGPHPHPGLSSEKTLIPQTPPTTSLRPSVWLGMPSLIPRQIQHPPPGQGTLVAFLSARLGMGTGARAEQGPGWGL